MPGSSSEGRPATTQSSMPYPTSWGEPPATPPTDDGRTDGTTRSPNAPGALVALLLLVLAGICGVTLSGVHSLMSQPGGLTLTIIGTATVALCAGLFVGTRRRA